MNGILVTVLVLVVFLYFLTLPFRNFFSQTIASTLFFLLGFLAFKDTNDFGREFPWFSIFMGCCFALDAYKITIDKKKEKVDTPNTDQHGASKPVVPEKSEKH